MEEEEVEYVKERRAGGGDRIPREKIEKGKGMTRYGLPYFNPLQHNK